MPIKKSAEKALRQMHRHTTRNTLVKDRVGFLTKSELFRIPAFGTAMRKLGCVAIDRQHEASARAALQLAARRVRDG
ncbi:MAG: 1-acyl-sn-glycerol-3-phosphate acyltransferase, partial [Bacteroidota bacterium]